MAVSDHANGTCGDFCPYCVAGVDRTVEAVRAYEDELDAAFTEVVQDGDYLDLLSGLGDRPT